jgi:hypothetical protein
VRRLMVRSGNRVKHEPQCRAPRAFGVDFRFGKLDRGSVTSVTGTPCSEVGFAALGNWSGGAASWCRRSWGAVDFGASGNWSEGIGFTTRTTCAVTIARSRGQPRGREVVRGLRVENALSGAALRAVPSGMDRRRLHGFGDHVRGPLHCRETGW